jgi:hypothetical protein
MQSALKNKFKLKNNFLRERLGKPCRCRYDMVCLFAQIRDYSKAFYKTIIYPVKWQN